VGHQADRAANALQHTEHVRAEFAVRRARLADVPALERMLTSCSERYLGRSTSSDETLDRLTQAGPKPERTAVVAETTDGRVVGFANVWPGEPGEAKCFARVDPDEAGRGIGTSLLEAIEVRARDFGGLLTVTQWAADQAGEMLLRERGYRPSRYFLRMAGNLADMADEVPLLPAGIRVRRFAAGDEDELYDAWSAAFASETGDVPESRAAWWRERRDALAAGFDPGLWLVAVLSEEIAGFAIGKEIGDGGGRAGYISDVGVRREYRGQGLGTALLHLSFRAMRARGFERVALDVDAENTTSALRLYRNVGLREEPLFTIWAKELPTG
jgi:mycothiol synthase